MRISVVTVCFNAVGTIADTLRSVQAQSWCQLEHIVVDGGSTDGTLEVLRAHGDRISAMVSGPDGGIYDAMNRGLRMATGDVVGFLNADDWYVDPDAISRIAAGLETTGAAAAYADIAYVDRRRPGHRLRTWRSGPFVPGAFARGWAPPHPTFFADRRCLLGLSGFDLRYRLAADFDLMLRAFEIERIPWVYVERELVHMRSGGATGAGFRSIARQNGEIVASLWRAGFRTALPGLVTWKAASRIRQRFSREVGSPTEAALAKGDPHRVGSA